MDITKARKDIKLSTDDLWITLISVNRFKIFVVLCKNNYFFVKGEKQKIRRKKV